MEQKTIKALFVNGGPRKNKNTAQMLQDAMQGAKDAGADTSMTLTIKAARVASPVK